MRGDHSWFQSYNLVSSTQVSSGGSVQLRWRHHGAGGLKPIFRGNCLLRPVADSLHRRQEGLGALGDQLGERVVLRSRAGDVSTKKSGLGIADRIRLDDRRAPLSVGYFDGRQRRALETFELSELPSTLAADGPVRPPPLPPSVAWQRRRQETHVSRRQPAFHGSAQPTMGLTKFQYSLRGWGGEGQASHELLIKQNKKIVGGFAGVRLPRADESLSLRQTRWIRGTISPNSL